MTRDADGFTVDMLYVWAGPDESLAESAWKSWQILGSQNENLKQAELYAFDHNGAQLLDLWKRDTIGQPMPE